MPSTEPMLMMRAVREGQHKPCLCASYAELRLTRISPRAILGRDGGQRSEEHRYELLGESEDSLQVEGEDTIPRSIGVLLKGRSPVVAW